MVRMTLIARTSDGLALAEGLDSDKDPEVDSYKAQAKVGWQQAQRQQQA
jgi:vesicle transport protein SEC22